MAKIKSILTFPWNSINLDNNTNTFYTKNEKAHKVPICIKLKYCTIPFGIKLDEKTNKRYVYINLSQCLFEDEDGKNVKQKNIKKYTQKAIKFFKKLNLVCYEYLGIPMNHYIPIYKDLMDNHDLFLIKCYLEDMDDILQLVDNDKRIYECDLKLHRLWYNKKHKYGGAIINIYNIKNTNVEGMKIGYNFDLGEDEGQDSFKDGRNNYKDILDDRL